MPPTSITLAGCSSSNSGCITLRYICTTNCDCVFRFRWCEWWRSDGEEKHRNRHRIPERLRRVLHMEGGALRRPKRKESQSSALQVRRMFRSASKVSD